MSCSYGWGFLSDKYGRRPILLIGVFGSMVSTSLFGLSPSYGWAIAIRTFGGLMNSMALFPLLSFFLKIYNSPPAWVLNSRYLRYFR